MNNTTVVIKGNGEAAVVTMAWSQLCATLEGVDRPSARKFFAGQQIVLPDGRTIKEVRRVRN